MKHSIELTARQRQPDYRRIFEGLRAEIVSGRLKPGTQLPSTRELAATWGSNILTIHMALTSLTKEGWLDRRHGAGTFIADPEVRFSCAGIYLGRDIEFNPESGYARSLHFSLLSRFEELKKDTQVFVDARPDQAQGSILPSLADAIKHQRIQCVVAPALNGYNVKFLSKLTIPTALTVNPLTPGSVDLDMKMFFRGSIRRLAAQGCRTVGLITPISYPKDPTQDRFYVLFEEALREEGLALHKNWERAPKEPIFSDFENHGYTDFKNLWKEKFKPEGLIAYPDHVVRGVILAILEIGMKKVTRQMKFVFHRNAHLPILCPVPVTWATTEEDAVARALIELIQKQFRREEVVPILVPPTFEENGVG